MDFYALSLHISESPYSAIELADKPKRADPPKCTFCGADLSPRIRLPPHRYRLIRRDGPGDLLTDRMVIAVSRRFVKAFNGSGLMGLTFSDEPIELIGSELEYYMAFPECTLTLLDEAASGMVIKNVRGCEKCRVLSSSKIDRIVVNEKSWQGQDVFRCGNLFSVVLTTQRFVDFATQNRFTNFRFIHQSDYFENFSSPK